MISFADDSDGLADSEGDNTGAFLTKPNMPKDFTVCAAYMVEAWTTAFTQANLFYLDNENGDIWDGPGWTLNWIRVVLWWKLQVSDLAWCIGVWYTPLTWSVCVAANTTTGNVTVVVDRLVVRDDVHDVNPQSPWPVSTDHLNMEEASCNNYDIACQDTNRLLKKLTK